MEQQENQGNSKERQKVADIKRQTRRITTAEERMDLRLLWIFVCYSFLGFLLEVAFARAVRHPKKDRKCFFLLPLCPVYGLGALMIRGLTLFGRHPLWVALAGFAAATAAELLMGAFYRYVLGVEFWSYRQVRWNFKGLVCLPFSLCWTVLALGMVYWLDPWVLALAEAVPRWLDAPMLCLLAADGIVSAAALKKAGTTDVLRWYT